MSAETLRRAAALMRERAEAATPNEWRANGTVVMAHSIVPFGAKYVADCYDEPRASEADATHIASWHPAVALAVADLMDALAVKAAWTENAPHPFTWPVEDEEVAALYLAQTYLGAAS